MRRYRSGGRLTHLTIGPLVAVTLALGGGHAAAQRFGGDPEAGHVLAQRWCSSCHLVERGAQSTGSDAVPTFPAIARMPALDSATLQAFMQTPHPRMPDLGLSRVDLDNLAAYLVSLRPPPR